MLATKEIKLEKELPQGWYNAKLGETISIIRGISFPKDAKRSNFEKGLIACLRTTNVQKQIEWEDLWFVDRKYLKREEQLIKVNDIIISTANSLELLGKSAIIKTIPYESTLGTFITNLRASENVNPKYIYYYLCTRDFLDKVRDNGSTTTNISNISVGKLEKIEIKIAPLPEQHRIVEKIEELFSELDTAIATLKTTRQQLQTYRQSVLKHAFEGHFTGGTKGWHIGELGDTILKIEAGKSFRCDERTPLENEVGVLKVSAVSWGEYNEEESKTVIERSKVNQDYFVKQDDFLFSRANTIELVGACVIVKKVSKALMLSDKTLRIVFNNNINPRYALYYLRSKKGRNEIEELSTGNQESMRNIGQQRIKQIRIPLPDVRIQNNVVSEIETRLSESDSLLQTINQQLIHAESLRQSILQRAFSGEL